MNRYFIAVIIIVDVGSGMLHNTIVSRKFRLIDFHSYDEKISDGLNPGQTRHDWAKTKDY